MAEVAGTVTYGGEPVTEGTIQFYPTQAGPMAVGRLADDGTFVLSTSEAGDGARVGEYIVVVVPPSDINRLQSELKPGQKRSSTFENIPASIRNQQTSTLMADVEAKQNSFTFDLKELESHR
ncbi:hypothetical protein NG895_24940 [Aeoliella sp. ICT_H6.2]|uniref:Carboxypeptidase regulatory-like domain-containing protein n=1 Tax=Aeoliella straminimaris TaxID=2954799 RepID=A0A9X2JJT6_9BACT|nr:hypothetical protein [Aeoliella straminimaris]MCO6047158.1 hypothetical protein [Aeoliella straminimaris]